MVTKAGLTIELNEGKMVQPGQRLLRVTGKPLFMGDSVRDENKIKIV